MFWLQDAEELKHLDSLRSAYLVPNYLLLYSYTPQFTCTKTTATGMGVILTQAINWIKMLTFIYLASFLEAKEALTIRGFWTRNLNREYCKTIEKTEL